MIRWLRYSTYCSDLELDSSDTTKGVGNFWSLVEERPHVEPVSPDRPRHYYHCTLLLEAVQGIRAHVLVKLCSDTVATPVSDSHLGCAFHRVKRRYQYVSQERDGGPACRLMGLSIITCVKNGHIVPRKLLPPLGHRAVLATSTSTCLNWQSHRSVCQSQRGVAASQPCPERWLTKRIRRA